MRRRGLAALGLLVVVVSAQGCAFLEDLFIAAGRIPPFAQVPCGEQSVTVIPGDCTIIFNVCRDDLRFITGDSFAFDDPPEWLSARRLGSSVEICAASNAPPVVDAPFPYTYADQRSQRGELRVSTVSQPVSAQASATPDRITVGGSSQLNVVVQGGAAPFSFAWRQSEPAGSVTVFNDATLQNPMVTIVAPPERGIVRFEVTVTDAAGQTAVGEAGVAVNGLPLRVTLTATPSTINRGASSQLLAVVEGGIPPYTYEWDITAFLEFDDVFFRDPDPLATPPATRVYTVGVRDFHSATATSTVTITVLEAPAAGADISVSVTDNPDPVLFNQLLTYTITVTNNGPQAATLVNLSVMAPAQAETGPLTPSQGTCMRTSNNFNCAIGTMNSGASVTATIPMFPFVTGPISLTASVSAAETDPNTASNTATQQTTVLGF
jgi:uncharacterized repeat protein (TIGR01451 family)